MCSISAGRPRKRSIHGYVSIYRRPVTQPLSLRWDFETTSNIKAPSILLGSFLARLKNTIYSCGLYLLKYLFFAFCCRRCCISSQRWQSKIFAATGMLTRSKTSTPVIHRHCSMAASCCRMPSTATSTTFHSPPLICMR